MNVDEKRFRYKWTEQEQAQIKTRARLFKLQGAINDDAAWDMAEREFIGKTSPYMRKNYAKSG